jgi:F-type H+-transporting ATPase subunit b
MHFDHEFFVAVAFILFACALFYMGVHRTIVGGLDARSKRIADELAEAKRLRDETEVLLASFKQKAIEAEQEAADIVKQAIVEAEAHAKEAAARIEEFVVRRTKQAETKIALAEAQATADVRTAAADAAVRAAEFVLKADTVGQAAADLVAKEIAGLKERLN